MTAEEAINGGLLAELMTVVEQPEDPEGEPIIPPKLEGNYKLSTAANAGKFSGYELSVKQTNLQSERMSGREFVTTDELIKFLSALKEAGAKTEMEETGAKKYTAKAAIEGKLRFKITYGETEVAGDFEVSEGVIKIKQKSFKIGENGTGEFATATDLVKFIEKCWEELKLFDEPKRLWMHGYQTRSQGYQISQSGMDYSERSLERNRKFWSDPERYLSKMEDRSRFFKSRRW